MASTRENNLLAPPQAPAPILSNGILNDPVHERPISTATSVSENEKLPQDTLVTTVKEEHQATMPVRGASLSLKTTFKRTFTWVPSHMVLLFAMGLLASIGHHLYYQSLHGDQVGTEAQQQWSLRFGGAFAHVTQISFIASIGVAYTQWLWRTLSKTGVSIEVLDGAGNADTSAFSLFNVPLIRKLKICAFLAVICWCLQLPSLITTATLSVVPVLRRTTETAEVHSLDMYGPNQQKRFTVSINAKKTTKPIFLGPRTIVQRLVTAAATEGQILPINPPFPNSTYLLNFFGPAIKCGPANDSVASIIHELRRLSMEKHSINGVTEVESYYYGFVPEFTNPGNSSLQQNGVKGLSEMRMQQPANASNELWMTYASYVPELGEPNRLFYNTTCKLYNATYTLNMTFLNANQTITPREVKLLNEIHYPKENIEDSKDLMLQHAYSAFMWAIADLLVGNMGKFNTTSKDSRPRVEYGEIKTQISRTSLVGSRDLRVFFDMNRELYTPGAKPTDQTAEDIEKAGNQTLPYLIEQLGYRAAMSFMNSNLLSPKIKTTVEVTRSINTYSYSSRNLLIAYGLSLLFALIANILGAYAFWANDVSYTRNISAWLLPRQDPSIPSYVGHERVTPPLNKRLNKLVVQFFTYDWTFRQVPP